MLAVEFRGMTHNKNYKWAADSHGLGREERALCPLNVEANPSTAFVFCLFVTGCHVTQEGKREGRKGGHETSHGGPLL